MDTSRCTPGQARAITTLDRPLMISAGAGSGKTFTLTQRIAYAMTEARAVASLDEVCAITYTKAAAAELRSRIKGLLIREGMAEAARRADEAWISTIHAMAARILRENAFAIGIDPGFEVLGSMEQDMLLVRAVDTVAAEALVSDDPMLRRIVSEEPLFGHGPNQRGIMDDVSALLARVRAMPAGFDGIRLPAKAREMSAILADMGKAARALLEAAEQLPDEAAKDAEFFESIAAALDGRAGSQPEAVPDAEAARALLYAFPFKSKLRRNKGNVALIEARDAYRSAFAQLSMELECALGMPRIRAIVALARRVDAVFGELKGPSRLDNDDLLRRCYQALADQPGIAARYRDRFKLIMVDEFQDTDRLQTALIGLIARPGLANVCTVGDAQQSIYRFRGADVNVFLDYQERLRAQGEGATTIELPDNFRSHGDVLALVDALFEQPDMFGDGLLRLEAAGAINDLHDPLFDELPRIGVDVVHYQRKRTGPTASAADARRVSARHIAERFAELRQKGARASDMALLLGGMTHADEYARALREAGLESRIMAGSIFQRSPEAQLVASALRLARNMLDEEALLQLLFSPLFALSDDVLLAAASRSDGEDIVPGPLAAGFFAMDERFAGMLSSDEAAAWQQARDCLQRFVARAQAGSAAAALRGLLAASGLLDRLQQDGAAGLARAGDAEKACRLVAELERDACGIAELSDRFSEHLRLEKETPGLLTPTQGEYVTIMTIHGSKGLEFPHVAVAEATEKRMSEARFIAENHGEATYLAGTAVTSGDTAAIVRDLRKYREAGASAPVAEGLAPHAAFGALSAHARSQETAEAKRLLYVALTRAVSSLLLALVVPGDAQKGYEEASIVGSVHAALPWPTDTPDAQCRLDFGGTAPAAVRFTHLPFSSEMAAQDEEEAPKDGGTEQGDQLFEVALRDEARRPVVPGGPSSREGMHSYTSLSAEAPGVPAQRPEGDEDAAALLGDAEKATDLGTAFHRLAQQSILRARASGSRAPLVPSEADIRAQVRSLALTAQQQARLRDACRLWFSSPEAQAFFACEDIAAEVPFSVAVGEGEQRFCLVGEIDGLATCEGEAFLIDYKTGGSAAEPLEELRAKHLLQAQCYAFALLSSGFSRVRADFLRVEQPDAADAGQPQIVRYAFDAADAPMLERRLIEAHRTSQAGRATSLDAGSDAL